MKRLLNSMLVFSMLMALVPSLQADSTRTKAVIGKEDVKWWDGITRTFTRKTSAGGEITMTKFGDYVDVLEVYGDGSDRSSTSINKAISEIGSSTKARLVLSSGDWTLNANVTLTSNLTLVPVPGCNVIVGSYTFTMGPIEAGNYKWLTVTAASTLSFTGPNAVNALWAADGDGTDDSTSINELIIGLPNPRGILEIPYTASGYGLSSALVIPEAFAGSDGTAPSNITIKGINGKPKLIGLGAINLIETYDVTVVEPTKWTFGLRIENLELDGDGKATNGLKLHGIARGSAIRDIYAHEFTNAAIYASRWIETTLDNLYAWGDFSDPTNSDYGIYQVDGTTVNIIGGQLHAFQTCYHIDGNLTEASADNNDGPDYMTMTGTVMEDCGQYAIHITAGDNLLFNSVDLEDCGDNYASAAYCIGIDDDGGEDPEGIKFNYGSISVDTSGNEEGFYINDAKYIIFDSMRDGGLSGGIITSTASYAKFVSGEKSNDFRITNCVNLTGYEHDGGDNQSALSDASGDFINDGVSVGQALYNLTDGSSCIISARTATTVTCTLVGGTGNDWDDGDLAAISQSCISDQGSTQPLWIENGTNAYRVARGPASYQNFDQYGNTRLVGKLSTTDVLEFGYYDGDDTASYTYYIEASGDMFPRDISVQRQLDLTAVSVTISGGIVTASTSWMNVTIENHGVDITDDLNTITATNMLTGALLLVRAADSTETVVAKDGTGNLYLSGDCTLDHTRDSLLLIYNGSGWQEISCADNE